MTRAELLRRRAELLREAAAIDEALAKAEERDEQREPTGWISQLSSPLGKRRHLTLWRQLRDQGSDGARACGKARLIRANVFEAALVAADDTPRRRRHTPTASGVDLAEAFGVSR